MNYNEIKKMGNWDLVCKLMILCNREGIKSYRCELDTEFAEDIELMRKEIVKRMGGEQKMNFKFNNPRLPYILKGLFLGFCIGALTGYLIRLVGVLK